MQKKYGKLSQQNTPPLTSGNFHLFFCSYFWKLPLQIHDYFCSMFVGKFIHPYDRFVCTWIVDTNSDNAILTIFTSLSQSVSCIPYSHISIFYQVFLTSTSWQQYLQSFSLKTFSNSHIQLLFGTPKIAIWPELSPAKSESKGQKEILKASKNRRRIGKENEWWKV